MNQKPGSVINCGNGTFMCYTYGQKVWKFHGERSCDKMPGEEGIPKQLVAPEGGNRQKRHSESVNAENTRKLGRSSSTGSNYSSSESECSSQPSPMSETAEDILTGFLSPSPPSDDDVTSPSIIPEQEIKTELSSSPPTPVELKNKVDITALSNLINSLLRKHSLVQSGLELLKQKPALALRLQQRRPRKVLADQGIIPPLKSPAAFYEQIQKLERARTGDFLNKKMLDRPERDQLVQKHILEDTSAYDSLVAHQKELKKAQLADDLNEKIFYRPGVFELVEKNIIPADETVAEALKGGHVQYKKVDDYTEEDSSDAFSPEQPASHEQGSSIGSPPSMFSASPTMQSLPININSSNVLTQWVNQVTLASSMNVTKHDTMMTASSSKMPRSGSSTHTTAGHPYLYRQASNNKSSKSLSTALSQRNMRKKKESKPKFKKFKYHQYIPPDQQGKSAEQLAVPEGDSPYSRLLEQQQLYLQLQIMKQHFPTIMNNQNKPSTSIQRQTMTKYSPPPPPPPPVSSVPPSERKKRTFTVQQLEEMKVAELKEELKARKEKVTGTKEVLVERLKKFAIQSNIPVRSTNQSVNESITGLINATIQHTIRHNTEQALAAAVSNNGAAGALLLKARTMSPPLQQNHDNRKILQTQISPPPSFAIQVVTSQQESRPVSVVPMDTQNQEMKNQISASVSQPSTFHFASTSNGVQIFSAAPTMNTQAGNKQLQPTTANNNNHFQFNTQTCPSNLTFSTSNIEPRLQNTSVAGQRVIATAVPGVQFKVEGSGKPFDYSQKLRDELLHKQQKEIEDLKRMVELHRTQLHQFQEKERQQDVTVVTGNTNPNMMEQHEGFSVVEQSMKRQHISQMLQKHLQNKINNKEPQTLINGITQHHMPMIKQEIPALPDNVFNFSSNTMPPNVSLIPLKPAADSSASVHVQSQDENPIILSIKPPLERSLSENKDPPKYDQAIQMLNEEKRRLSHQSFGSQENIMGSPATDGGVEGEAINADMEDILDLIAGGGELPVTPTRQKSYPQSVVIDHRQPQHATMHYHYQHQSPSPDSHSAAVHRRSMEHLHRTISCNELEMQQHRRSLELPALIPLSDMSHGFHKDSNMQRRHSGDILDSNLQRRHSGDLLSYSNNHSGLTPLLAENQTDFTSLLVSSAGDILMDSTRVPPSNIHGRMSHPLSPETIVLEPTLQCNTTPQQHRSLEDLTKNHPNAFLNLSDPYATQPFSPMDTGSCDTHRNNIGMFEERLRDPHLSSSSIHDSELSLDKCLDSVNVPHHTGIYLRHYEQPLAAASPQRNSHLIKSSSQEILSEHEAHMDHSMQVDDLGWLDLTLTARYQAPPSPMTLQQQRASVHSSMGSILGHDSVGNPFQLGVEHNEFDLIDSLNLNSIGNNGLDSWDGL